MVEEKLTPEQTKQRIVALLLVFAVVIFFWMAFHQNGLTLTFFARDYTAQEVTGLDRLGFNIVNLTFLLVVIYGLFSLFQGKTGKSKTIAGVVVMVALLCLGWSYTSMDPTINILPQIFQQFNPFFVIALTPVSLAVFGYLARKGKEPSAPRKIGIGMMIAVCGFLIMAIGSIGLPTPDALAASGIEKMLPSVDWSPLISTSPMMTIAGSIAGVVLAGIPLAAIIFVILRQIFNWSPMSSGLKWSLLIIWILAVVIFVINLSYLGWPYPFLWVG